MEIIHISPTAVEKTFFWFLGRSKIFKIALVQDILGTITVSAAKTQIIQVNGWESNNCMGYVKIKSAHKPKGPLC